MNSTAADIGLGVGYSAAFIGYHILLWWRSRVAPETTVMGISRAARTNWILLQIRRNDHTMVFQALRNLLNTASTMSTTAISTAFGMFAFITGFGITSASSSGSQSIVIQFAGWKLCLVMAGLFMSFFLFGQSMRMWSHVAFLLETKATMLSAAAKIKADPAADQGPGPDDWFPDDYKLLEGVHPSDIAKMMNSGSAHYTWGTRAFYFSFPLLLWFFSGWYFLAGGVLTLVAVITMDSARVAGVIITEEDAEESQESKRRMVRRKTIVVPGSGEAGAAANGAGQQAPVQPAPAKQGDAVELLAVTAQK
ncbi:hypothetical protein DFJ74DRAFT_675555 [Hyaloraphidium curvatum]|nr:hypothetical protein DFJ74DRAFT_675555 [Hyaloraphidium curvatum]